FFLNFFKNFFADYKKNKSNNWDYLISLHEFKDLNQSSDRLEKINYLIEKYNRRLLFYSRNKANPWVIDDREKNFITLHRKNYLAVEKELFRIVAEKIKASTAKNCWTVKEIALEEKRLAQLVQLALLKDYRQENSLENSFSSNMVLFDWQQAVVRFKYYLSEKIDIDTIRREIKKIKQQAKAIKTPAAYYLKELEYVRVCSASSIWEKTNARLVSNKIFQFFATIWNALSAHATLLSWISLLFLFFSLSLYSFPIVFLLVAASVVSYLAIQVLFLVKKEPEAFHNLITPEGEALLERVKIDVFNIEKNKAEFGLLQNYILHFTKDSATLDRYVNILFSIQEKFNSDTFLVKDLKKSSIYHYLKEVYPKTQFIASLIINLSSVLLYAYLLTWAINGFLTVVGATALASIAASPLVVGVLILAAAGFFLVRQLFKFRAREDYYQRTILSLINEKCTYQFKNSRGELQVMRLEKWKKFEYLRENNRLIELEIKPFLENKKLDASIKQLYLTFSHRVNENGIYAPFEQDKLLGSSTSAFKKIKKIFNRFFAFSDGVFCGFDLSQQIVWKSSLGLRAVIKASMLPLMVFFVPFIIINAIVNLLTYHLNSRQRDRFNCAKNLDSKIEVLEQTNKKLLYLAAVLKLKLEDSSVDVCSRSVEPQIIKSVTLNASKVIAKRPSLNSLFFSERHAKTDANLDQRSQALVSSQMNKGYGAR
ncbi:MAG: hypothetical protein RLZZ225_520, partial [Pseudomonadota bacterium]